MNNFFGDYHTHTTYSHGTGSILDNALAAKEKGIKEIAITDHGLSHALFSIKRSKLSKMRKECEEASRQTGVNVLLGVEANLVSHSGNMDMREGEDELFDIINCGFHKAALGNNPGEYFSFCFPKAFDALTKIRPSERIIKDNTKAIIELIKHKNVDIITHVNYEFAVDAVEIAKAASDYGVYLEISAKKRHVESDVLYEMDKTGVKFIVNSDAHSPERVGEFELAKKVISEAGIDFKNVANYNALPVFKKIRRG